MSRRITISALAACAALIATQAFADRECFEASCRAHLAFSEVHGTLIPASRIRNKEVPNQPSRGRDLLGLEDEPLVAVIGEIKASAEACCKPRTWRSPRRRQKGWLPEASGSNVQGQSETITSTGFTFKPWRWASLMIVDG